MRHLHAILLGRLTAEHVMNSEKLTFAVGVAVLAGGSLGLILHRLLPEKHVTGGGKDMVGAVVGLFTLLALSYSVFSSGPPTACMRARTSPSRPLPPRSCNLISPCPTTGPGRMTPGRNCERV